MLNRFLSNPQNFPPMEDPGMVVPPNVAMAGVGGGGASAGGYQGQASVSSTIEESSRPSSWFGGLFGGKKEDTKSNGGGGGKTEVLESFDAPSTPIPSFEYK